MDLVRRVRPDLSAELQRKEWIIGNGLGGYATGMVAGTPIRRHHGWLVAALPAPLGRFMLLNHVVETIRLPDGRGFTLCAGEEDLGPFVEFRLEWGLPVWRYEAHGVVVERSLVMPHLQNSTHAAWRLCEGDVPVQLEITPWMQFRSHGTDVNHEPLGAKVVTVADGRIEIAMGPLPPLRLTLEGPDSRLVLDGGRNCELLYRFEAEAGYPARGALWSPGAFTATLGADGVSLVASTEPWHIVRAMTSREVFAFERDRRRRLVAQANPCLRTGPAAELVVAADSFVIQPRNRVADATRARSAGDDVRSVIAGYHWFTDWGRDTMISLEGLTLVTGRPDEARWILKTFAHYIRDGLIPNMFPDNANDGLYHTADATLWFFHAVDRYLNATGDERTLRELLPKLVDILEHHRRGTRFGIAQDPADGLLRQGAEGYQLTWMDAKVDDWVVTPRRGKAVEINALWYNALMLMAGWLDGDQAARARADAKRVREAFNARFWSERHGHLMDVVDGEPGDDPALRPNQLFAIALPHPVLDQSRWRPVVEAVRTQLLTPVGLRSLAPLHPDYKPRYFGNLRARDAAYHQGTVWGWLIGPFIDAWLKVNPGDRETARGFLDGFLAHLDQFGIGTIAEVFDADPPFLARGCIAQAWSVAEWLRAWVRTEPE